ncbi:MAG: HAF repeat/PEP-CTERM domain-containing protein [Isosphaeraceae bacterium]
MAPRRIYRPLVFGTLAVLLAVCAPGACADALYSVTDLGSARPSAAYLSGQSPTDPSGNYLGALSSSQQTAFQAGSFDVYAHPGSGFNAAASNPDYGSYVNTYSVQMVTGNNIGEYAGSGGIGFPQGGILPQLLLYTPDPHIITDGSYGAGQESSGYMSIVPLPAQMGGNFYGAVAGINDHSIIAYNYQVQSNSTIGAAGTWIPYLSTPSGGTALGTLGGASAFANALNNSNDVVGWSLTASGAQHAFLYANGTMQDLNLLIPPLLGITLVSAVGVDSAGDIVAYGTNSSGQMQEYYLSPEETPAPEPGTLAVWGLIASVAAARLATRSIRKKRDAGPLPRGDRGI